jgi:uncharacterized protein (DUF169 family)
MAKFSLIKTENPQDFVRVAVYWTGHDPGYGGPTKCKDLQEAIRHCQFLRKSGYGKPGLSEIHVIQCKNGVKRTYKYED